MRMRTTRKVVSNIIKEGCSQTRKRADPTRALTRTVTVLALGASALLRGSDRNACLAGAKAETARIEAAKNMSLVDVLPMTKVSQLLTN